MHDRPTKPESWVKMRSTQAIKPIQRWLYLSNCDVPYTVFRSWATVGKAVLFW